MKLLCAIIIVLGCIFLGLAMETTTDAMLPVIRGGVGSGLILAGAILLFVIALKETRNDDC